MRKWLEMVLNRPKKIREHARSIGDESTCHLQIPSIDVFVEIAVQFGVSLDWVIMGKENRELHK